MEHYRVWYTLSTQRPRHAVHHYCCRQEQQYGYVTVITSPEHHLSRGCHDRQRKEWRDGWRGGWDDEKEGVADREIDLW